MNVDNMNLIIKLYEPDNKSLILTNFPLKIISKKNSIIRLIVSEYAKLASISIEKAFLNLKCLEKELFSL